MWLPVHRSDHTVGTWLHRVIIILLVLLQHMPVAQYKVLTTTKKVHHQDQFPCMNKTYERLWQIKRLDCNFLVYGKIITKNNIIFCKSTPKLLNYTWSTILNPLGNKACTRRPLRTFAFWWVLITCKLRGLCRFSHLASCVTRLKRCDKRRLNYN